jgi:glucose-1-phosphate thymidylyltransferase
MKGVILHGGHGTRLRPLTHTGPKQLLPIANKPMSQFCLEAIVETGITDIAMIIGGIGSNKVREYYGNGKKFGVKITYIEQDEPRGIADAIRLCKDYVNNDKFLVFLGDNIIQRSIIDFVENFKNSNYDASVLLCEVDNPSRFGIADVENERILKITEKPKNPTSSSDRHLLVNSRNFSNHR